VAADEGMMDEMSGITPGKQGLGKEQKATVAQINFTESNAKIDLFSAIVGDTFFRQFYYQLAKLIQKFETDETVFLVANATFQREHEESAVGFIMDRAAVSNQASANLMSIGQTPPNGLQFINIPKIAEDLFKKMGQKNLREYFFNMKRLEAPQEEGAANQLPAPAGRLQGMHGLGV
jgi:hypothetical protein